MATVRSSLLQAISSHQGDVLSCAFSGRLLAIGSSDKLVRLFHLEARGDGFEELPQSPLCAHSYAVNFCHFTPLGTLLCSCSQDGRAIIWDARTGRKVCQLEHESRNSLRVCQFSPDGRLLATGSDDETAVIWDVTSRKPLRVLEGHESSVLATAFSPDGAVLCTGSSAGDLRFWDARFGSGRLLALEKEAHDLGVPCAQFSPSFGARGSHPEIGDSSSYLLATGGTDNLVKLWRITVAAEKFFVTEYTVLKGHNQNIMCLSFSPNGNLLASGSGDKTVLIWDPIKGEKIQQLSQHQRYVTCVAFSSDGALLASGSNDKTALIWRISDGDAHTSSEEVLVRLEEEESESERLMEKKPVSDWTVEQVGVWLTGIQLAQYKEAFRLNRIDGQELVHLTDTMLKKGLAVEALGHRNRILRAVKELQSRFNLPEELVDGAKSQLPHEYFCPITHEVMTDPVIASDGYTYERSAISAWIDGGRRTSPMTNAVLPHLDLTPNRMLKMLIQKNRQI